MQFDERSQNLKVTLYKDVKNYIEYHRKFIIPSITTSDSTVYIDKINLKQLLYIEEQKNKRRRRKSSPTTKPTKKKKKETEDEKSLFGSEDKFKDIEKDEEF